MKRGLHMSHKKIPTKLQNVLKILPQELTKITGDNLLKLILYGSYAKGNVHDEADVDLFLLFRELTEEVEGQADDILYRIMWDMDFDYFLSPYFLDMKQYQKLKRIGSSFLTNVEDDGIILWENTQTK